MLLLIPAKIELANYYLSRQYINEAEEDKAVRLCTALAQIPDLYTNENYVEFKKIFIELLNLNNNQMANTPLTWQQIFALNQPKAENIIGQVAAIAGNSAALSHQAMHRFLNARNQAGSLIPC